ncbi:hypothetical protein [Lacinutrix undariae]
MNNFAKGTELLNISDKKYRTEITKKISDFKYNLPTIYKVFIENYIIGRGKFKEFKYLDNRFDKKKDFLDRAYRPHDKYILVYELLSITEIIPIIINKNGNFDFDGIDFNKTIPIGECDGQKLLFVGIDAQNLDEIFIEDEFSENKMKPIAKNIFQFVSDIELFYDDTISGFSSNLFYKNITENFWRIKE